MAYLHAALVRHRILKLPVAMTVACSLVATIGIASPTALDAALDPPSCNSLIHTYFQSGLPNNTRVAFTMVTQSGLRSTYAESDTTTGLTLTNATLSTLSAAWAGSGMQYFNYRRLPLPGFNQSAPFNYHYTRPIQLVVRYRLFALEDRQLWVAYSDAYGTLMERHVYHCNAGAIFAVSPILGDEDVMLGLAEPVSVPALPGLNGD
jgi:hypothetical protein